MASKTVSLVYIEALNVTPYQPLLQNPKFHSRFAISCLELKSSILISSWVSHECWDLSTSKLCVN